MRTFIAFPLPVAIKEELKDIQEKLKECKLEAKWVEPYNLHITLKFLGEIPEDKLKEIEKIIEEVTSKFSSLAVNLTGFGFFPHSKNPRVFFVTTDKEKVLKDIADYLENELEKVGFRKEGRFKSHITLARIKSKRNIDCIIRKMREINLSVNFPMGEIALFKSTLTPHGPIYEKIFKANLKS